MRIPHDPVALEEHFKDDDEGPVSNQGYMPYLNKFVLDKVPEHAGVWPLTCWTGSSARRVWFKTADAVAVATSRVCRWLRQQNDNPSVCSAASVPQ